VAVEAGKAAGKVKASGEAKVEEAQAKEREVLAAAQAKAADALATLAAKVKVKELDSFICFEARV
jgi:hypothetical protein